MMADDPKQPPPKKIVWRQIVKVSVDDDGGAVVTDKRGAVVALTGAASKRFARGERRTGYFRAEQSADGILEIGDRVPDPEVEW